MIRVMQGDITKVTGFQAIVNSANNSLLGGGGIDGQIHRAAGPQLRTECRRLNGCETGASRLTLAYNLPCEYVIHSVGPVWMGGTAGESEMLKSCYESAMSLAMKNKIRTLAFTPISGGEYGYPAELSSKIAVSVVVKFVEKNPEAFDDICWVVNDEASEKIFAEEIENHPIKKTEPKKKKPGRKGKAAVDTQAESVEDDDKVKNDEAELTIKGEQDADKDINENAKSEESDEIQASDGETADKTESNNAEDSSDKSIDEVTASSESDEISDIKSKKGSDEKNASADSGEVTDNPEISNSEENGTLDEKTKSADKEKEPIRFTSTPHMWDRYDIDWLDKEIKSGRELSYVTFWHGSDESENSSLSHWHRGKPFFINGRKYDTVEQFIMSEKALLFNDFGTYTLIMGEPDASQCKKYGRNVQNFDDSMWDIIFREVIFHGYVGKATSDTGFANELLATGDAVLIEASPFDDIYGAGMKKSELLDEEGNLIVQPKLWHAYKSSRQGHNHLGFVLMAVRDYLKYLANE